MLHVSKHLVPAQAWQMTSSRLTDAHSGLAEPQSPQILLKGFSHRRCATWLQDRALRMDEDRLSSQTDSSLDESTDRLQAEGAGTHRVNTWRTKSKRNLKT